jgi:hypothetical protein
LRNRVARGAYAAVRLRTICFMNAASGEIVVPAMWTARVARSITNSV